MSLELTDSQGRSKDPKDINGLTEQHCEECGKETYQYTKLLVIDEVEIKNGNIEAALNSNGISKEPYRFSQCINCGKITADRVQGGTSLATDEGESLTEEIWEFVTSDEYSVEDVREQIQ